MAERTSAHYVYHRTYSGDPLGECPACMRELRERQEELDARHLRKIDRYESIKYLAAGFGVSTEQLLKWFDDVLDEAEDRRRFGP